MTDLSSIGIVLFESLQLGESADSFGEGSLAVSAASMLGEIPQGVYPGPAVEGGGGGAPQPIQLWYG
ncbi:MAG: hypothetical protein ACYCZR_01685 [Burkholderiales bacterium]